MDNLEQDFDMGAYEAPENKEKSYIKPGYRKLTVKEFIYEKEQEGRTPSITVKLEGKTAEGDTAEISEDFYISGKRNDKNIPTALLRVVELYKGLTGESTLKRKFPNYSYVKREKDGAEQAFTVPNPEELCSFLNKECKGKSSVFKIGGEVNDEGVVYAKIPYTGFLYQTDRTGTLVKFKDEREFTEVEYRNAVRKRKSYNNAPGHNNGMNVAKLDALE